MSSVSFISGNSAYSLQQANLQNTMRSADQAQQTAQALEAQANAAQRAANTAQQNADYISNQAGMAKEAAGQADQRVETLSTQEAMAQGSTTISTNPPVINSQGQVTGRTINTTA